MEHAKKLILVEPRLLEQLQVHNEYKELQKPPEKKRKTDVSMEIKKILDEDDVGDDIKAKLYQQAFSRFLNLKDKVPNEEKIKINRLTPAPPPTLTTPARSKRKRKPRWFDY